MASSIVLGSKISDAMIFDTNIDVLKKFEGKFQIASSIEDLFKNVDVVLLSTKPFVFDSVIGEIKKYYKNQLFMSILAGVRIKKYLDNIPNLRLIRIMPNTPALVSEGMSVICPCQNVDKGDIDFAVSFMSSVSKVIIEDEKNIDIITALSGSGPAFYYKLIDKMAKSASKLGLDYKEALLLSTQTALGSAKMIMENNFDINQLVSNVTTKGGCTEVGNTILDNSEIQTIFDKMIEETTLKAKALG